jgi:hypothetical protein
MTVTLGVLAAALVAATAAAARAQTITGVKYP